jgi:nucleoid-associated protein YgaU
MSTQKNNEITPYNEESKEIVKRIEGPEPEKKVSSHTQNEYYTDTTYENTEHHPVEDYHEVKKTKNMFPLLAGITTVGIIGYFGFNYLQEEDKPKTTNKAVAGVVDTNPIIIKGTSKEELINYYVNESLDIKKKPQPTKESIEPIAPPIKETPNNPLPKTIQQEEEPQPPKEEEIIVVPKEPIKAPIIEKEQQEVVVIEEEKPQIEQEIVVVEKIKRVKTREIHYQKIKPRIIRVKEGDTLVSIAERFYNDGMDFKRIIRVNRRIRSSKTPLHVGQKVIIPRKDGKKRRRFIIVERGDTLASISKNIYGTTDKILTIVKANYRIKSRKSLLRLGQKVYVPRENF